MKNITVPVDFSGESLKGLDLALLFSLKTGVHIHMIHVLKYNSDEELLNQEYLSAERQFESICELYSGKLRNDSRLTYSIASGKVYEEVLNVAEADPSGIIAMSTHGQSGFEDFFLGGQAFRIISASTQPVITIRKKPVPASVRRIVIPIDSTVETRQKVPAAAQLAKMFGAEVYIAVLSSSRGRKVQERLTAYSRQVEGYFDLQGITWHTERLTGNNRADLTIGYAGEVGADLLVIMSEQEASMTNLILGNYAQQVLNKAEIPVLNITPKPMYRPDAGEMFLHSW